MYQLVASGRSLARFPVILVLTFLCPIYKLSVSSVSSCEFGRFAFPFFFSSFCFERLAFFPLERNSNLGTKTGTGLSLCRHKA